MGIVLQLNEWLNKNAPTLKGAIRAFVPHSMRRQFAQQKFAHMFQDESYAGTFKNIYNKNWWGSNESLSGCGSELTRTEDLRMGLGRRISNENVHSLFDAPCGDFNWMSGLVQSAGIKYVGADIVDNLIFNNRKRYPEVEFHTLDILKDELREADAWLCRDVLFHFPNDAIKVTLERFRASNFKYFLTSHFENVESHPDIIFGLYRPVNLTKAPFNWPEPDFKIFDGDKGDPSRFLGIWRKF